MFGLNQDTEIFPKQTQLTKDSETGQLRPGQFINLPYFGEERKALNVDGTPFTLQEFMKVISANLVTKERLKGITEEIANELLSTGIDVITSGNHVWDKKEIIELIEKNNKILRPANFVEGSPGLSLIHI